MNNLKYIVIFIILALVVGVGVYVSKQSSVSDAPAEESEVTASTSRSGEVTQAMPVPGYEDVPEMVINENGEVVVGSYEVYEPEKIDRALDGGTVVLFFKASWCPTCQALDRDIKANLDQIPAGVSILETDYDKYKDLKKKYNVTYQHTLVQVDSNGEMIKKWSGSPTLDSILSNI